MTDHERDDQLIDELRDALAAADPVPDDVLAAAKASFTWRTVDAELAELAFDSATDDLAGVRSEGDDRSLTFRTGALEIEVMVRGTDPRRLTGQLIPPQPATVELVAPDGTQQCAVGAEGVFWFDDVPDGPVSIRCRIEAGGTTITTEATVL